MTKDPPVPEARAATHEAMRREPMPSVFSAWEGDERTEAAYRDGWLAARSYYATLIEKGWPDTDPCVKATCVLQRGHAGEHTPDTKEKR